MPTFYTSDVALAERRVWLNNRNNELSENEGFERVYGRGESVGASRTLRSSSSSRYSIWMRPADRVIHTNIKRYMPRCWLEDFVSKVAYFRHGNV